MIINLWRRIFIWWAAYERVAGFRTCTCCACSGPLWLSSSSKPCLTWASRWLSVMVLVMKSSWECCMARSCLKQSNDITLACKVSSGRVCPTAMHPIRTVRAIPYMKSYSEDWLKQGDSTCVPLWLWLRNQGNRLPNCCEQRRSYIGSMQLNRELRIQLGLQWYAGMFEVHCQHYHLLWTPFWQSKYRRW